VAYNNHETGLREVIKKVFGLAFLRLDYTVIQAAENAECDLTTVFERLILELQALVCPSITIDMINDFITYYRVTWMVRLQQWNVFGVDMHRPIIIWKKDGTIG
jgi:hypothetical protein